MEHIFNHKKRRFSAGKIILMVLGGIAAAVFFSALFAVVVTYLWNWLMPAIFGLSTITYLQAFGLIVLARLLVGGWHKGDHNGDNKYKNKFQHFIRKKKNDHSDNIDAEKEEFYENWKFYNFHDFWENYGKDAFKKYNEKKSNADKPRNIE